MRSCKINTISKKPQKEYLPHLPGDICGTRDGFPLTLRGSGNLVTAQQQFAADQSYGYGCLMSALQKGTASHMTLAFEDTKEQAGRDYSNDHKMEVLYGRLRASGEKNKLDLVWTCETIPTITSFDKACIWFISQDRIESHLHSNTAKIKAHVAESLFYDAQEPKLEDDTLFDEFYRLMAVQHDDKYHLPSNVFRGLSREARTMFYQMRDNLTKAQKQLDDKTSGTRGENKGFKRRLQ